MLRGEIYVVDLGPGGGREVSGPSPVVVISSDTNGPAPFFLAVLPAVGSGDIRAVPGILVPGAASGYSSDIAVLARQPRTIGASRFTSGPVGAVPADLLLRMELSLRVFLGLWNGPLPPP